VVFGMVHFLDRNRPVEARRQYVPGVPVSATGRALLASAEVAVGFVLLFTA